MHRVRFFKVCVLTNKIVYLGRDLGVGLVVEDVEGDAADDGLRDDVTGGDHRLRGQAEEAPVDKKLESLHICSCLIVKP